MTENLSPDHWFLSSPRKAYYKLCLDPKAYPGVPPESESPDPNERWHLEEPTKDNPYNCLSSLCLDGYHRPALDYDLDPNRLPEILNRIPGKVVVISSTNNYHIYAPEMVLTWGVYRSYMEALMHAGLMQTGYYIASVDREQSILRAPHVNKWSAKEGS